MNKQFFIFLGVAIALVALAITEIYQGDRQAGLLDVPQGGDFVLDSQAGQFSLEAQRGKVVLIYFGYTFCPDICPTNLSLMAQALNELETNELENVVPVFVSVDPERDKLDHLDNYSRYFHQRIIGVTGDASAIADIAKRYGAAYQKVAGESEGGYLIDHSSFTYLVDQAGKLAMSFPHATDPLAMVDSIRRHLHP